MDKYPLYLDGKASGELTVDSAGMYADYRAVCRGTGPTLLRAYLVGERGEALLGVLAPEGGGLAIRRRLSRQETGGLGKLLRCEARRSGDQAWEKVSAPEQLLTTPFFANMLRGVSGVLTRREGARRWVAVPYEPSQPFPMAPLFCFAKRRRIGERDYLVYAFDGKETPLMP